MRMWPDHRVLDAAGPQHWLITTQQLRALGYSDSQIRYRLAQGVFGPVHPGVIALPGVEPGWATELSAAVLWSGGIASHHSAAALHGFPGCDRDALEVTTHDHRILSRCGLRVHHTNRMPRDHVTERSGIPCTSAERTLLDLGACVSPSRVAMAVDHALLSGQATLGSLDFCLYLTARRGRRGCAVLRDVLKPRFELETVPNSPLESYLFGFLRRAALPIPIPQFEIFDQAGDLVARPDFVYPVQRVAIEAHSAQWHSSPEQRKRDVQRHERVVANGYRVLYVTWYDLRELPGPLGFRIESLLKGDEGHTAPPTTWPDVRKEW